MSAKIFLLTILGFLILVVPSQGQSFKGGFRGGLTTSEVSGDNLSGPTRLGWFATAFTSRSISESSEVVLEIMYIQKGSRSVPNEKNDFRNYSFFLQYVEIPVWYRVDISRYSQLDIVKKLKVNAALSVSFLVGYDETDLGTGVVRNEEQDFNKAELNFLAGLSNPLYKKFDFTFSFSNSLTPIRPHRGGGSTWYNRGQYNTVWTFGVAYNF